MTSFRTPTRFAFSNEKIYFCSHTAERVNIAESAQYRRKEPINEIICRMNLNPIISECRTLCENGRLEQFWEKCNSLGRNLNSNSLENDQMVNVAITQVDSIINDNDSTSHAPFNLGLLLMRIDLKILS